MFVIDRAMSKLRDGRKRQYYYCHRSYNHSNKNENHEKKEKARETKFMGSNKIEGTCPAMMKVTYLEHEGTVHVKFWENHYGHDNEIGRIRIDEETRTKIAGITTYLYKLLWV